MSWLGLFTKFRSSHPEVFCKKGVLRNFTKFTGKHLRQSLFFNKVAGLRPVTLFKKRLWHRCFPLTFAKFLRTPFFMEHFWWLLLKIHIKILFVNFVYFSEILFQCCFFYVYALFSVWGNWFIDRVIDSSFLQEIFSSISKVLSCNGEKILYRVEIR